MAEPKHRPPALRPCTLPTELHGLGNMSRIFIFLSSQMIINNLPNNEISNWSKLEAFADDKIKVTESLKFGLGMVQNVVGKEENAVYTSIFLFSYNVFKRLLIQGL